MSEQQFELVFCGDILPDFTEDETKANLAKLFKADAAQIEKMFTGKPVVIKHKLNLASAKKYLSALRRAGANCALYDMASGEIWQEPSDNEVKPEAKEQTPPPTTTNSEQPAPDPGIENRPGSRPDLSTPDWSMAPPGSNLSTSASEPPPPPAVDHIDLSPQEGNIVEPDNTPPPKAPDTSHISLDKT